MIPDNQDAFGHAILDWWRGDRNEEAAQFGCRTWFSEYDEWSQREKDAVEFVRGRVLDVGCAAGRHSLYLQQRGHDVVAIDSSPLAVQVAGDRGVRDARVLRVTNATWRLGIFGTIVMFGNNFGLMGDRRRARWLLKRLKRMTPPDGRILAGAGALMPESLPPAGRLAVERNVRLGELPGAFTLRPCYRSYVSPPIKWLYASQDDVARVVDGTGWAVRRFIEDDTSAFVAVIEKT